MMPIGRPSRDESSAITATGEEGNRTKWDFELRGKLDRLADLDNATRGRVVQEALEVDDKYGWKRLDERRDLLARLAQARWADMHGLKP
jgi:predicted transcriptional regulator